MLNRANSIDPTGNAYAPKPGIGKTGLFPGRIIQLGNYQLMSDETGKDCRLTSREQSAYMRDTLPYTLLAETTGADTYECRGLLIIIGTEVTSHNSITSVSFPKNKSVQTRKGKELPALISIRSSQEIGPLRKKYEITDLANNLRELSGLDVESLAQIFKVSRVTYHRWLRGLPVSKRHRDYILEILPLLKEAAQRLGSPEAVSAWLLTPTSSGGKKPIEYLAEKRYDLFRGFLLHQPSGKEQFRPLKPSKRVFQPRKREEIADVREQLRPHTWYNEDENLDGSDE